MRSFLGMLVLVAVALSGSLGEDQSRAVEPYRAFAPGLASDSGGPPPPTGTITIAGIPPNSWDPHFSNFAQDIDHFYMVWRGLYDFDTNMTPVPSMAAAMPLITAGGTKYTVALRQGLLWSDGQPLDADDFVAGTQRTCNPDIAGEYQFLLANVVGCDEYRAAATGTPVQKEILRQGVGVKALDARTIEITLEQPQPTFTSILAMWPTFPVPTHKVTAVGAPWPAPMANVYNGPFRPTGHHAAAMTLGPNPHWAGAQKPKVAQIVIAYPSGSFSDAYRAGAVDAASVAPQELPQLSAEFPGQLHLYAADRTIGLQFKMTDPLLAKSGVRLALSRATNRALLNAIVFQGGNIPTTSWVPSHRNGLAGGEYDNILGFNVAAAKQHLSDAGYANGQGWPGLTLVLTDSATNRALGEFLRAEWKAHLNIDISQEFVSSQERSVRYNTGAYQMLAGGWQEDYPDPETWFVGQFETGGSVNKTFTSVPALDALIAAAKFNPNDAQRRQQYRDAEMVLLQGAHGVAPVYHSQAKFLVRPYITGMVENKRGNEALVPGAWSPEYWATTQP